MKLHLGRERNGGSGASIRFQKHALSWSFAVSQGREVNCFGSPGSHRDVFTVICVLEPRDLDSVWSIRRFIVDEDPLFHKGFLERIFDPDPEGFPLTNPT